MTVKATPPAGNPSIDIFEASVVGGTPEQKCNVTATVNPIQCEIANLAPDTEYTVSMKACMPNSTGCGAAVANATRTLPNRTLNKACGQRKDAGVFIFIFLILAPRDISIESVSPNTLKVTLTPDPVSAGVSLYKVSADGKACEIAASMSPLSCSLTELTPATEYTVEAKACSSASHCSEAVSKLAWTLPNGEFLRTVKAKSDFHGSALM